MWSRGISFDGAAEVHEGVGDVVHRRLVYRRRAEPVRLNSSSLNFLGIDDRKVILSFATSLAGRFPFLRGGRDFVV